MNGKGEEKTIRLTLCKQAGLVLQLIHWMFSGNVTPDVVDGNAAELSSLAVVR